MTATSRPRVLLGTAAAAGLLLLTAPTPVGAVDQLREAGSAADPTAPLVALLSLVAWVLAGWLALTVAVTAGGHLPGAAGRALAAVAARVAPATVRRAVEVALGLTVAVGVLGASPAAAAPGSAPSLDWSAPVAAPSRSAPALDWAATVRPAPAPAPATPATTPPAAEPRQAVVVQPGDSLWDLAESHLAELDVTPPTTAEVAQAWPSWWAANRDVVGDDPHLIRPGTHLTPPTT